MRRKGTSHSAAYGQACTNCVKAKTRCIPQADRNECERCHRLKKPCAASQPTRGRAADKKQEAERIARLERLVSQLQTANAPNQNTASSLDPADDTPMIDPLLEDIDENNPNRNPNEEPDATPSSPPPSSPSPSPSATARLTTFRTRLLPHLPLLHLPEHLPLHQLRHNRPFLFCAIICVTAPTARERRARAEELKRVFCERAFFEPRPSEHVRPRPRPRHERDLEGLDVLLGLLTLVAWGWHELLQSRGCLERFVALAAGMVGEVMGAERSVALEVFGPAVVFGRGAVGGGDGLYGGAPSERAEREIVLERQRAALGCFLLGSAVSGYFGQVDGPQWTQKLEESLTAVGASSIKEYPADGVLALQVRLQLLAVKAVRLREQRELMDLTTTAAQGEDLLRQLKELRESRAMHLGQYKSLHVLDAQVSYAEVCILESISPATRAYTATASNHNAQSLTDSSALALSAEQICLPAIAVCTSSLLAVPPSELRGLSFPQWAQLTRCIAVLHTHRKEQAQQEGGRMHAMHLPDLHPDRAVAGRTTSVRGADPDAVLTRVADALTQADKDAGETKDGDSIFRSLADGIRRVLDSGAPQRSGGGGGAAPVDERSDLAPLPLPMPPQMGYWVNPRFWLDQLFLATSEG